jgi:Tfp pilus assembly protein PilZ
MGMFDKIKSIWWRFPKREEPLSGVTRFILASEAAEKSKQKEPSNIASTDEAAYPKKRRYPRYPVQGMDIRAHMLFSEEIDLHNLSVSGACIRTMKDLRLGGKYLLRIQDDKIARSIRCKVIWKRDTGSDERIHKEYTAGLQFQNIASDELVSLKDFMRNSGVPVEKRVSDEFRPGPLRFSITLNKKAALKCPKTLNVRTISLGGMLIESESAPELESRHIMKLPLLRWSEPIKLKGRIASILPRKDSSNPLFDIGVEFLAITDTDRARLDCFIRSL